MLSAHNVTQAPQSIHRPRDEQLEEIEGRLGDIRFSFSDGALNLNFEGQPGLDTTIVVTASASRGIQHRYSVEVRVFDKLHPQEAFSLGAVNCRAVPVGDGAEAPAVQGVPVNGHLLRFDGLMVGREYMFSSPSRSDPPCGLDGTLPPCE